LLIPRQLAKEYEAFEQGLRSAGLTDSVTTIWAGSPSRDSLPEGTVFVAENPYLPGEDPACALAIGGHNGAGDVKVRPERWKALGREVKPWTKGRHILVCESRNFGLPYMRQPQGWTEEVVRRLRRVTDRPIQIRQHPGNWKPRAEEVEASLMRDLEGAHCCVIWNASAGVRALLAGIPVIYGAPHWICAEAGSQDLDAIETPPLPERMPAFYRLASSQYTLNEIRSGEAFRLLC
jgi:hypothetical protein